MDEMVERLSINFRTWLRRNKSWLTAPRLLAYQAFAQAAAKLAELRLNLHSHGPQADRRAEIEALRQEYALRPPVFVHWITEKLDELEKNIPPTK
jgi:hypothetical protein